MRGCGGEHEYSPRPWCANVVAGSVTGATCSCDLQSWSASSLAKVGSIEGEMQMEYWSLGQCEKVSRFGLQGDVGGEMLFPLQILFRKEKQRWGDC